jgi:hypothetical protein
MAWFSCRGRSCRPRPKKEETMSDSAIHFVDGDFYGTLMPEGFYAAVIGRARFYTSRQGNTTLQVRCDIEGSDGRCY